MDESGNFFQLQWPAVGTSISSASSSCSSPSSPSTQMMPPGEQNKLHVKQRISFPSHAMKNLSPVNVQVEDKPSVFSRLGLPGKTDKPNLPAAQSKPSKKSKKSKSKSKKFIKKKKSQQGLLPDPSPPKIPIATQTPQPLQIPQMIQSTSFQIPQFPVINLRDPRIRRRLNLDINATLPLSMSHLNYSMIGSTNGFHQIPLN